MKALTLSLSTAFILSAVALFIVLQSQNVEGSSFTGSAAVQSIATTTTVGPTGVGVATTIFQNKPSCTGRSITTGGGEGVPIRFLTGDPSGGDLSSTTLTMVNGLIQAASTTVMYDSGTYGCGRWTARAISSTTITVVEYQ